MKKQEGPVGAALALEQPAEDGEGLVGTPVGDGGAVVPADDQVGALALADLVGMIDSTSLAYSSSPVSKPPRSANSTPVSAMRRDHGRDGELALGLDVDHDQRRAVVVGLEAALGDLAERDRQQPVGDVTVVRRPGLERDVE